MQIQENVDLLGLNSFGVSSVAAYFAEIQQVEDLAPAIAFARQQHLPLQILGGGSNTLFINDYPGLVLHINNRGIERLQQPGRVRVAAGENWHEFVTDCLNQGLHGLENLALIPGTVGAAPIQNIGAYGVELQQFFVELEAFDLSSGERRHYNSEQCEFAYRDSIFKHTLNQRAVVLSVTLQLHESTATNTSYPALREQLGSEQASPRQVFDAVCRIRSAKLPNPDELGNAGSFFKNPLVSLAKYQQLKSRYPDIPMYQTEEQGLVKIPAAWMLDAAGWKGRQRGRAAVHEQHALVVVNLGGASGDEILLLAQEMSQSILEKFGIGLEPEVRIV